MTRLALIAGSGHLPLLLFNHLRQKDIAFKLFLSNEAEKSLYASHNNAQQIDTTSLGDVVTRLEIFKQEGGRDIIPAGNITPPSPHKFLEDLASLSLNRQTKLHIWLIGRGSLGDNKGARLFKAIITRNIGLNILAPHKIMPSLRVFRPGALGIHSPSDSDWRDIKRGRDLLNRLSKIDVGQSVIVREGKILGIEASEHTAGLIERCGDNKKGGVLIKLPKKGQLENIDWPAIGPETVEQVKKAKLHGIALQAGGALLLDRQKLVDLADRQEVFIEILPRFFSGLLRKK